MALQAIPQGQLLRYGNYLFRDNGARDTVLDALGEYAALIFNITQAGTIDRVHFNLSALTADGDGLRIRLETVDLATGLPSGTLVAGSSEVTVATAAAGWNRSPAGLGAVVAAGDLVALKFASPATGTTFQGTMRLARYPALQPDNLSVYLVQAVPTAAKYTGADIVGCAALEYNDGSTPMQRGLAPFSSISNINFGTGNTYDAIGNVFRLPFRCSAAGVWGFVSFPADTADFVVEIRDASHNVIASHTRDANTLRAVGGYASFYFLFASPVTLEANTTYRVVVRATTTSALTMAYSIVDTTNGGTRLYEAAGFDATDWLMTRRASSGGAWDQVTDRSAAVGIVISGFEDGAAAGGLLTHPGMAGGMRG